MRSKQREIPHQKSEWFCINILAPDNVNVIVADVPLLDDLLIISRHCWHQRTMWNITSFRLSEKYTE